MLLARWPVTAALPPAAWVALAPAATPSPPPPPPLPAGQPAPAVAGCCRCCGRQGRPWRHTIPQCPAHTGGGGGAVGGWTASPSPRRRGAAEATSWAALPPCGSHAAHPRPAARTLAKILNSVVSWRSPPSLCRITPARSSTHCWPPGLPSQTVPLLHSPASEEGHCCPRPAAC